jgi:TrmH family RNA methyltransferase
MPDSLFNKCASTDSPQGIITICPPLDIPNHSPVATATLTNAQFILLCDDVADPGNLGTIIRTADSAGVDAIILSNNSADIYNPKTVRSTMGSLFNVPIIRCNLDEFVQNNNKFTYIATSLYNSTDIFSLTLAKNATPALIVGNEANGIHDSLLNIANHKVIIPIYGNAESLNVAVATGIALYQIKSLIKVG